MKLSEIKTLLATAQAVNFQLPDGSFVPEHFHVTEVGLIDKHFIDCGGTERREKVANFQLWDADDTEHRLKPQKLIHIISLSEKLLGMPDLEIEVEYQSHTIGKYDLGFNGTDFLLLSKHTNCLAKENCGLPEPQQKTAASGSGQTKQSCTPGGKCC